MAALSVQMFCNLLRVAAGFLILVLLYTGFTVVMNNQYEGKSREADAVKSDTMLLFLQRSKCGQQTFTYILLLLPQCWAQAQVTEIITMGLLDEMKLVYGGPNL